MKKRRIDDLWFKTEVYTLFIKQLNASYLDEKWVDTPEIQKLLKISESTVKRLRKDSKIPCCKLGNRYYYPLHFIKYLMLHDSILQFYQNRKEEDE